jgi:hypothetical protein
MSDSFILGCLYIYLYHYLYMHLSATMTVQSFRGRISGDEDWKALRGEIGKTAGTGTGTGTACAIPLTATATDSATATVSVLAASGTAGAANVSDNNEEDGARAPNRIDIPFFDDDDKDGYGDVVDEGITDKAESRETGSKNDSNTVKPSGNQGANNQDGKHTEIDGGTDRVTLKFVTLGGEWAVGGVPFDSTQHLWSAVEAVAVPTASGQGESGEQVRGDGIGGGKDFQMMTTTASPSIPSSSASTSADLCVESAVARITSIQQVEDKRFHRCSTAPSSRTVIPTHAESVSPSAAAVWENLRVSEITVFTG